MDPKFNINLDVNDIGDKTVLPIAKQVSNTFGNIWFLVFGKFDNYVEKQKLKYAKDIELFKQDLENKTNKIPIENLQEPNLSIVGPALEGSKFYIGEPDLRDMFSTLISNSMNKNYNGKIRNSFVEIIKQLEPIDASILSSITNNKMLPVANIYYSNTESLEKSVALHSNVLLTDLDSLVKINEISASVTNLNRLGLINLTYDVWIVDNTKYDDLKNTQLCIELKENLPPGFDDIDVKKGVLSLTPLGKDFISVCL